jgi:esterase
MKLHVVARGEGPAVALLHGLYGQAGNFGTVQRRLAAGRRVLALDLRNHGASARAATMTYPEMAADVLETLAAHDALPCALIGHSMGGKVAMRAALDRPEAVTRLLVADIAPVAYAHGHGHVAYVEAMQAIPLTPSLTRAEADAALAEVLPTPAMRAFLLQNLRFDGPGGPRWRIGLEEIAASLDELTGWPPVAGATYDGPTLFLSGARSDYVLAEYRPAIAALFPRARFAELPWAGHWLHADDPEGFIGAAEAFLSDA